LSSHHTILIKKLTLSITPFILGHKNYKSIIRGRVVAHIIVLGNEKGGTGKSTVGMHIIVSLLKQGYSVGTIDIDARQGTLSRYIENRKERSKIQPDILVPEHFALHRIEKESLDESQRLEAERLNDMLSHFKNNHFVVIDTPGSDRFLSCLAHSYADTLITPLNDSPIDLDVLVRVSGEKADVLKPSIYSEMVWEQKKNRAKRDSGSIDWIVLRNRLSPLFSRNKEEMGRILGALSKRVGFRIAEGFCERVIFRELFFSGLTLLDMKTSLTLSHITAKQELATLMKTLNLPKYGFEDAHSVERAAS
jgi:chromosome partitioning protein